METTTTITMGILEGKGGHQRLRLRVLQKAIKDRWAHSLVRKNDNDN